MSGKDGEGKEASAMRADEGKSAGGGAGADAGGKSGRSLMEKVMDYCRTRKFLKIFEDYILNNLKHFKDADPEEHRLNWTEIFQDYLRVFEDVLAEFIDKEGGNYSDFYQECREKQSSGSAQERVS